MPDVGCIILLNIYVLDTLPTANGGGVSSSAPNKTALRSLFKRPQVGSYFVGAGRKFSKISRKRFWKKCGSGVGLSITSGLGGFGGGGSSNTELFGIDWHATRQLSSVTALNSLQFFGMAFALFGCGFLLLAVGDFVFPE